MSSLSNITFVHIWTARHCPKVVQVCTIALEGGDDHDGAVGEVPASLIVTVEVKPPVRDQSLTEACFVGAA